MELNATDKSIISHSFNIFIVLFKIRKTITWTLYHYQWNETSKIY